jgi:TPR repeat protein
MPPRTARHLLTTAACCTALLAGPALAQSKAPAKAAAAAAKSPAAKAPAPAAGNPAVQAATPCNVLADDPDDPFRAAAGVQKQLIDASKAVAACKAAIEAAPEDGRLRYALGRALERSGDDAGAGDAYQRAAERGYPIAENMVGMLYLTQAHQPEVAAQWMRKSADHGYLPAQMVLGTFYHQGIGVPKDAGQAAGWYRKAADAGYPLAQVVLAGLYHKGDGVAQDDQQALALYRKAAAANYAGGQGGIGDAYYNGWGVKRDAKEALAWYQKAAEQGYPPALAALGVMYHNGEGGLKVDDAKAAENLKQAVELGFAPARPLLAALQQGAAQAK